MDNLPSGAASDAGPVRVQGQLPAPAVDAHIVMKLAEKDTISDGGNASVGLMSQVMHVTGRWPLTAAGPLAVPGAEGDSAADGSGNLAGVADVEDDRASVL